MEIGFWLSLSFLIYVYVVYPILLFLISLFKNGHNPYAPDTVAAVSMIIAAHNEEAVISDKLNNCLAFDYPKDMLDITVASDSSSDQTDQIVSSFTEPNIILLKNQARIGKTGSQNEAARLARGQILVFSDANSLWEPAALKRIVSAFSDESVSYACGTLKYTNVASSASSYSEGLYWRYEMALRRLESKTSSITAGNGAIYAIRSSDYYFFPDYMSHDFEFPRYFVSRGKKAVFVESAVAYEKAGLTTADEYKRKARMLARVWGSIIRFPSACIIFNNLFYSWKFVSHRLFRYIGPFPQLILFFSNFFLCLTNVFYQVFLLFQLTFYFLALCARIFNLKNKLFYIPFYLCMFNFASLAGFILALRGQVPAYWSKAQSTRTSD